MRISGLSKGWTSLAAFLRADAPALSEHDISNAISLARIFLISSLIFTHYDQFPNMHVTAKDGFNPALHPLATFVNSFVAALFMARVPLLAAISGWLFFTFKPPIWGPIKRRIASRFRSLYLLLVVWNALYLALLYGLHLIDPVGHLSTIAGSFDHYRTMDYVNAVFAITDWPIDYPFWFIRDLFVIVLMSPLLSFILRRAPYLGAAVFTVIWLSNITFGIFSRADIVAFFFFGGLLRTMKAPLAIGRRATIAFCLITLCLVFVRVITPAYLPQGLSYEHFPLSVLPRLFRLFALLAAWGLFLQAARKPWGISLARFGGAAIFVFAAHAIVLDVVKQVTWPLIPGDGDGWMLAHYALTTLSTLVIVYGAGLLLRKFAPDLFDFLTGGRVGPPRVAAPPAAGQGEIAVATPQ